MTIILRRKEIKTLVQGFTKIIATRAKIAILGYIKLDSRGGSLTAQATNLDEVAIYRFAEAELEEDGSLIVPFQLMKDLAKGGGGETITLTSHDGKTVSVTNQIGSHAVTHTVECLDTDDWPDAGADIRTAPATGFMATFRRVAPFASTDPTRPVLSGVFVDVDVNDQEQPTVTLVATDGRRMTCCNHLSLCLDGWGHADGKAGTTGVVVPVTKFLMWNGLSEDVTLGVAHDQSNTRVCLADASWTYVVKAITERYPNWRQVIPSQKDMAHEIRFTDSEVTALRQILPTLPGSDAIVLEGASGKLSVCTADATGKTLTVPLTAGSTYTGSGCRLILDRGYLLDALNGGFRRFLFADTVTPVVSHDENHGIHVLMPLREDSVKHPVKVSPARDDVTSVTTHTRTIPPKADTPVTSVTSVTTNPATTPSKVPPARDDVTSVTTYTRTSPPTPSSEKEEIVTNEKKTINREKLPALEALQESFDSARVKLRETQSAFVEVNAFLRQVLKEERQRQKEADSVRSTLLKLQSIAVKAS